MPTARELLEEVDALMRRNRAVPEARSPLADVAPAAPIAPEAPETHAPAPEAQAPASEAHAPASERSDPDDALSSLAKAAEWEVEIAPRAGHDEIPVLTDVAEWQRPQPESERDALLADVPLLTDEVELPMEEEGLAVEPSLSADAIEPTIPEELPDNGVVAAPPPTQVVTAEIDTDRAAAPTQAVEAIAGPGAAGAPSPADWASLAEDIRFDVLQRIDLFTDTGLQTRLREHLQPIVDRATAEMMDTISRHVGELVRDYVGEAIEREIEKRRDAR